MALTPAVAPLYVPIANEVVLKNIFTIACSGIPVPTTFIPIFILPLRIFVSAQVTVELPFVVSQVSSAK